MRIQHTTRFCILVTYFVHLEDPMQTRHQFPLNKYVIRKNLFSFLMQEEAKQRTYPLEFEQWRIQSR